MIHSLILISHIVIGMASFVLASLYLLSVSVVKLNTKSTTIGKTLKISVITTALLGTMLIVLGAPLGRTCIALSIYVVTMVAIVKVGDKIAAKRNQLT